MCIFVWGVEDTYGEQEGSGLTYFVEPREQTLKSSGWGPDFLLVNFHYIIEISLRRGEKPAYEDPMSLPYIYMHMKISLLINLWIRKLSRALQRDSLSLFYMGWIGSCGRTGGLTPLVPWCYQSVGQLSSLHVASPFMWYLSSQGCTVQYGKHYPHAAFYIKNCQSKRFLINNVISQSQVTFQVHSSSWMLHWTMQSTSSQQKFLLESIILGPFSSCGSSRN